MVRLALSSRHSSSISCDSAMNSPFKQATLSNSSRKGYVVHIGSIYTRINAQTHAWSSCRLFWRHLLHLFSSESVEALMNIHYRYIQINIILKTIYKYVNETESFGMASRSP